MPIVTIARNNYLISVKQASLPSVAVGSHLTKISQNLPASVMVIYRPSDIAFLK